MRRLLLLGAAVAALLAACCAPLPAAAQDPEFIKKVLDSYQADLKADGEAAAAFCKSPAFKGASCEHNGIVSASEAKATITRQCPLCGTLYTPLVDVKKLPATISGVDRYNQYHTDVVSLSCAGRVVVRAVFKLLTPTELSNPAWRNCTGARLVQMDEDPRNAASPVVRCELALPPSTGSEAERALRAKEGRCFLCTRCSEGGGCPSNVGTWYSDSYTTSLSGCRLQDGKYLAHRVGLNMNPGDKMLLAKFEVCNGASCFNRAYEEAKAKNAKKCVKGVC